MSRTALVLSGGGLFGAYQAGVWRRLEREVRVDLVAGASVGSLNGWWIASGGGSEELVEQWLDPSSGALTAWRPSWRGLLDREALVANVRQLTERLSPRIDFGVTLSEAPRLRSRLFRYPEAGWRHLVASCSVPTGYPPVRIDGRWYIDGGVLCAVPIWAAIEMGATRIYSVNVLAVPPSRLLRAGATLVRAVAGERLPSASEVDVIRIDPERALGSLADTWRWRRESVQRWVDQGERDAERVLRERCAPRR